LLRFIELHRCEQSESQYFLAWFPRSANFARLAPFAAQGFAIAPAVDYHARKPPARSENIAMRNAVIACIVVAPLLASCAWGEEKELPLLLAEDFEQGADHWQPTDPKSWSLNKTEDRGQVFSQNEKRSKYSPPHRSPLNFALLKDVIVGDFQLDADVKSTHPDYGHRDVCLFFGYQDPANFYYVHLGKQMDEHANQIFIVDDSPRTKISTKTTAGTPWDDNWHHLRVVRNVASGKIEVFFDDMKTPAMTADDKAFAWGQVGIGTFDDTSAWDKIELRGVKAQKP
jgi:hypothetical protein